jgi:hypothetical protein
MGSYTDAWVTKRGRVEPAAAGHCTRCGARLSVYRNSAETQCAPCASVARALDPVT